MEKDKIIIPKFSIDDIGRVLCEDHTFYNKFKIAPSKYGFYSILLRDRKFNCRTCLKYKNNVCYFSKETLKKIRRDKSRFKRKFKCQICKARISLIFNVLYKLLYEEDSSIKIALLCCTCYGMLNNEEPKKVAFKHLKLWLQSIIIPLFIVVLSVDMSIFIPNLENGLLYLIINLTFFIPFYFIILQIIRSLRRFIFLKKTQKEKKIK